VLTLSKQTVTIGEPVVAGNVGNLSVVTRWSVSPSTNSTVIPNGYQSILLFSRSGSYTVTATYYSDSLAAAPYDSSSSGIAVNDSVYADSSTTYCSGGSQVPIPASDLITLTPISYSDTGLVLLAHTQNLYGNNYPGLGILQATLSGDTYSFGFDNVIESPCNYSTPAPTPATGSVSLYTLNTGNYSVTVSVNGTSYQGSLSITATSCTFTWNYSSGVVISPLTITKQ
jgi:hypothetical protein